MAELKLLGDINNVLLEKNAFLENLFQVKIPKISLMVCSKEEFSKIDQEEWVNGFSIPRKNMIFVLNQQESKKTQEEWLKLIVHEMVHLFYLKKFETSQPAWFFEGLACYLAGQKKQLQKIDIKQLLGQFSTFDKTTYAIGYSILSRLLNNKEALYLGGRKS